LELFLLSTSASFVPVEAIQSCDEWKGHNRFGIPSIRALWFAKGGGARAEG
jgi:hypothetical protein